MTGLSLPERMREAANTLTELSSLFGYPMPNLAGWSAAELRSEADYLEKDVPA